MNTENMEKEFEKIELYNFERVGKIKRQNVRSKHIDLAILTFNGIDDPDKKIILTLWNGENERLLLVDYIITDENGKSLYKYNKEFNLDDFAGDWTDLLDEIEVWIDTSTDENLAVESKLHNDYDETDGELCIENLYSETDAMVTAKMMNDFGLSFTTTVENENPDLRRKPPFTADDIAQWFDEAVRIIRKRWEEDVASGADDETEYANGPICITADKYGTCLNVNLFSHEG